MPYRIAKVTMFCYGQKEAWYKRKVPSGMLPAIELDGKLITESDVILHSLEQAFGPLGDPMSMITAERQMERKLFGAWCEWLCYPSRSKEEEEMGQQAFEQIAACFDAKLGSTPGPWIRGGGEPSTADLIFVPYVERMNASLFYYKGWTLRDPARRANICRWFEALEARSTYQGTQSDIHTHAHDLPPQMGGCYANGQPGQVANAMKVDHGPWLGLPDTQLPEPQESREVRGHDWNPVDPLTSSPVRRHCHLDEPQSTDDALPIFGRRRPSAWRAIRRRSSRPIRSRRSPMRHCAVHSPGCSRARRCVHPTALMWRSATFATV